MMINYNHVNKTVHIACAILKGEDFLVRDIFVSESESSSICVRTEKDNIFVDSFQIWRMDFLSLRAIRSIA